MKPKVGDRLKIRKETLRNYEWNILKDIDGTIVERVENDQVFYTDVDGYHNHFNINWIGKGIDIVRCGCLKDLIEN